jgi:hypothetical protein
MIAAPLNALKGGKGEKVWKWESEEQKAFKAIKKGDHIGTSSNLTKRRRKILSRG